MTLALRLGLASTLYRSGKHEEATLLEREILGIVTRSMLPDDSRLMDFRKDYASMLHELKKYTRAANFAKELMLSAREYLEPEDPKH